ncbi:MAG: hypothetical protein JW984_12130 [Deltaproteobacteria bacterium]|uniref:Roadblock/LAMTOR2 domain-containing protein n=1 Tax=Candidatus Zymogenus saltonus TaxID=2844893 RepID=A0A9D8KFS0_9DELT|nr:hypothetical protein [Candidatus Zymogenus saltonus]
MVDFRSVLEEVVDLVPGSLAGMIIGRDGIPIEKYQSDRFGLDADMVCAEFAGIMAEVQKVISILHLEDLKDVTITMKKFVVISHMISEDYYFILIINPKTDLALSRYRIRIGSLKLRELM